ncbi:MAG: SGNH/GDSL hydrolase family protein [Saprospiraceae bacterium]|uniref:SGNH/GDSL hydrolase family protein n=1 Tax=Candidatus Brachybacter algidus TaxID=2982024 RepID=UPI00257FF99C|nr:SGNH/GDSL hydrolase family protein [Candidatus Brachybacter algidus]MBK7604508.1 SGNH/GDSL hydrolase family protein [Candidatus Brachybacter algidus]
MKYLFLTIVILFNLNAIGQNKDWANLSKYSSENKTLMPLSMKEKRIVFMGNSITEGWKNTDPGFFEGRLYIDRGISGQTTPQMLIRFRPDVIDLKPAIVIILAGINDIAENTGPMTLEETAGNIFSMAQLAKAANIKVIISSVLPANTFPWRPEIKPAEKVIELNILLKQYCEENRITYLDYYSHMVDDKKGLDSRYGDDGVHPNLAGYKVMEGLVENAIKSALEKNGK